MLMSVVDIMMAVLLMVASGLVISRVIEIPGMEGLVSLCRLMCQRHIVVKGCFHRKPKRSYE